MAAYDLEEQEQLDELKTWWKQHGNLVTNILLAVALALAAWQGWQWWQRKQAAEAAVIYFGIQQAAAEGNAQRARELAGELIAKYPATAYAAMGGLQSAKLQVEKGELKNAEPQLQWAAENAKDAATRDLARLRLAALKLDDKNADEALKLLAAPAIDGLAARFAELRGDALASLGKVADARAAYEKALTALEQMDKETGGSERAAYKEILQTKLDTLGGSK